MEAVAGLPAGYYCGIGVRANDQFCRTPNIEDADDFPHEYDAQCLADEFIDLGYPCTVVKASR